MIWQPIETAPKDGTYILVVDADCITPEADKAHWGPVFGSEFSWRAGDKESWAHDSRAAQELIGAYETATHWMPLPPPPQQEPRHG